MPSHSLRLLSATLHRTPTRTRMPFRFGIAVMTEAPHVFLHGTFAIDNRVSTGVAAEGLLPKWFDKNPEKSADQEIEEMLLVIRQAVTFAQEISAPTAFAFWLQLYERQMAWATSNGLPALLAHFGVSMVERALIDALARDKDSTLAEMLRHNLLGIDLGRIHPQLAGRDPGDLLPERPLSEVVARHTVGLSDPLTAADITQDDRVTDGLPQSLEDCIAFYGLHHFKLKLSGNLDVDMARLQAIAAIITRACGRDYAFTLDGNEQYKDFSLFVDFWNNIQKSDTLKEFFKKLLFIEQPLHRSVALDPTVARIGEWAGGPPMIIDESDAEINDLAHALQLGYAGTSHKNCKGVIKGVAHRCLINHLNASRGTDWYRMSGEDLVNIGPVALQQDLAAQAALGNETVERNGHHYFRGLSVFPPDVNAAMLGHHGDLYTPLTTVSGATEGSSIACLQVRKGQLSLASINAAPFGVAAPVPLSDFEPVRL